MTKSSGLVNWLRMAASCVASVPMASQRPAWRDVALSCIRSCRMGVKRRLLVRKKSAVTSSLVVPGERQTVMPSMPRGSVTLVSFRTMKPWPS